MDIKLKKNFKYVHPETPMPPAARGSSFRENRPPGPPAKAFIRKKREDRK
jgi:hypothetical protein